jgi:hypothetical protein
VQYERRALAWRGLDGDASAVRLDNPLHEREAQTVPVDLSIHRVSAAVEGFEKVRQIFRIDARSPVGDADLDLRPGSLANRYPD